MATIVVGVDGSEGSLQALRFAAGEARLRGARLHAVLAWEYPAALYAGEGWAFADSETLEGLRTRAEQRLAEAIEAVGPSLEGVELEQSVVEGRAAAVLLEAAKDADLLVVGTRGHGGFVGLLLGSVSQQCVHHASCPVVVVPPARS
ncbi:MAG TPA: universal stress protein [Gaiellaceae bacterium]|nr:universal stress protein [Gaiellaceae bacterium]HZT53900.1 universal stress protein [Gaiellaceae bacterium]